MPQATPAKRTLAEHLATEIDAAALKAPAARTDNERPQLSRDRVPLGVRRAKLHVPKQIPGYVLHIFNDHEGRVDAALEAGYEFVAPEEVGLKPRSAGSEDSRVSWRVGETQRGDDLTAYLLKIRQEWYDADFAQAQSQVDQLDASIREGNLEYVEKRHVPKGGIKMTRT